MTVGVIYYVLIFDLLSLDHKQWYLLKMNVSDIRNVKNKKIITIWFFCLIMPNLGELIFTLPVPTRHEIRKLEKVFLKLQKTESRSRYHIVKVKSVKSSNLSYQGQEIPKSPLTFNNNLWSLIAYPKIILHLIPIIL